VKTGKGNFWRGCCRKESALPCSTSGECRRCWGGLEVIAAQLCTCNQL